MVSLSARLKRRSLPPRSPPALWPSNTGPSYHAQLAAAGSWSGGGGGTIATAGAAAAGDAAAGAGETATGEGEAIWHGAPVFDAGYWHAKGGMALVRERHSELCTEAEALTAASSGADPAEWVGDCLALGWPCARVIDVEYDACAAQPDSAALRWLCLAQDAALFPQAQLYRLTARWAGCTEVFEHPLRGPLSSGVAGRIALVSRLPPIAGERDVEMRFYNYRVLFLAGVSFEMGAMAKTAAGALAMYSYITYLFKTDLFAPAYIELADAQPQHIHSMLAAINANTHSLAYDKMRATTGAAALQSSLRHMCIDMHNMADGRSGIIFCAAHFPRLESLCVKHTPDFRLPHEDPMNLGVLFSLPWASLIELRLPFISDRLAKALQGKCPALQFLLVLPGPRYERWTAYSQTFTPDGLHLLATQWPAMRQLVVRHAFRQALAGGGEPGYAPPSSPRMAFGSGRLSTIMGKASPTLALSPGTSGSGLPASKVEALPGTWMRGSFGFRPKHRNLRVLRVPYLQLAFATAMALLIDVPGLAVLEFTPTLSDPARPPSTSTIVSPTLRRRVSMAPSPSPELNAPFADPSTVYQLGVLKHPLESMVVHDACSRRYITSSWIQVMNAFPQLVAVTFVATSQEDLSIVSRVGQFCARNGAAFAVESDDRSRAHQTCVDFASSWGKAGGLSVP
ncbi:hypothetical protein LPJ61_004064 [Coemansia biformis]|uniref:Uncharacterized protein n=1 Tax=Coemansia biformis TaxID=1286918 RepID=A0A9W7YBD9_9FUNG|nr:hypothetical protein LPJ61_004064 [Coemansia biformis]